MVDSPTEGIVQLLKIKPKVADEEWIDAIKFEKGSDNWFTLRRIPSKHDDFVSEFIDRINIGQGTRRYIPAGHYKRGEHTSNLSFGLDDPILPGRLLYDIPFGASDGEYVARFKPEE